MAFILLLLLFFILFLLPEELMPKKVHGQSKYFVLLIIKYLTQKGVFFSWPFCQYILSENKILGATTTFIQK